MATGEFQFIFTTKDFDVTIAFYREGLDLAVVDAWDRGGGERGMSFQAASGIIVVMGLPTKSMYTLGRSVSPQGVSIGFEVDHVDTWYEKVKSRGLNPSQELTNFSWGERGFTLTDPNGIGVYIYSNFPAGQGQRLA
jgi:uncharacterized glyoxalase superfamily protein PhnB